MSISPSILLRRVHATLKMATGICQSKLHQLAETRNAVILMYHRIVSPALTDEYIEPGMYVTPETFRMHLSLLKRWFNVVSLQEITSTPTKKSDKPLCAITFDDGWLDFYTNAWPLLRESSLPATNFLPTEFIGTEKWFWTDRLADILKKAPKRTPQQSDSIISKIEGLSGTVFSRIDNVIKLLKPCSQEQIHEILKELEIRAFTSLKTRQRAFMNWDECREMKTSGLVTFGSHTAHHIIMTAETEQVCTEDLEISRKKLIEEHVVEPYFIPFCYPNGGNSPTVAHLVEKAGYHCAVTTKGGWINKASNPFTLNRVGMHQDMTANRALTLARISG